MAASYDQTFTHTSLGRELRGLVWERLSLLFTGGSHVLELNCGTGEDACWLAAQGVLVTATDGSPRMLQRAEDKASAQLGSEAAEVRFAELSLEAPDGPFPPASFDGAFSNFGGLNCVRDLEPLADALGQWMRPDAPVLLVVMGPACVWDLGYHLLRGEPKRAFRRLAKDGALARVGDERVRVTYPWPSELMKVFAPFFRLERVSALGLVLPSSLWPSSLWSRAIESRRHGRRLLGSLGRAERLIRDVWPLRYLGDHYMLQMRRR